MICRFAIALSAASLGMPAAQAQTTYADEQFRSAVDGCIQNSSFGEFDTIEAALARNQRPCPMQGVVRRVLPREKGLGHIVAYDAQRQAFTWVVVPDSRFTTMAGGGASPYSKRYNPLQWGQLPRDVRSQLKKVGNAWFWLLPVQTTDVQTGSYAASNAMGAQTNVAEVTGTNYTLAVPTGWNSSTGAQLVAEASVPPGEAREVLDHLALDIVFRAVKPCDVCFQAGTVERGTLGGPTLRSPYDIKLQHRYVYAEIAEVRFVDTRNGRVVASAVPRLK